MMLSRRFNLMPSFFIVTLLAALSLGCTQNPATTNGPKLPAELSSKIINVAPVTIEWADYWLKEQRRRNGTSDIESLRTRYQESLTRALADSFEQQGWQVSTAAAITARLDITNMRINAPDYRGALSDIYIEDEIGSADYRLSFANGQKTVAEHTESRRATGGIPGRLTETNRGLNYRAFERSIERVIRNFMEQY